MNRKASTSVVLDTDALSPDSLKAAFGVGVDTLFEGSTRDGDALDWSTLEFALHDHYIAGETFLVMRAKVLT